MLVLFIYVEFQSSTVIHRAPSPPSTTTSTPTPSTTEVNMATVTFHSLTRSANHSVTTATDTLMTNDITTTITTSTVDLNIISTTAHTIIQSANHSTSSFTTNINTFITTDVTTITTKSTDLSVTATTNSANTITMFTNSPTLTAQPDSTDSTSQFNVGMLVVIVIVSVVLFITIAIIVVGIIVVCYKRRRSKQRTEQEGADYSTIDEKVLQKHPTSNPEPVYFEFQGPDNKDPHYINNEGIKQADRVMQDPYSLPFDNQLKIKHKQVKIQDNPAYSASSGVTTPAEVNYCYVDVPYYRTDTEFV